MWTHFNVDVDAEVCVSACVCVRASTQSDKIHFSFEKLIRYAWRWRAYTVWCGMAHDQIHNIQWFNRKCDGNEHVELIFVFVCVCQAIENIQANGWTNGRRCIDWPFAHSSFFKLNPTHLLYYYYHFGMHFRTVHWTSRIGARRSRYTVCSVHHHQSMCQLIDATRERENYYFIGRT